MQNYVAQVLTRSREIKNIEFLDWLSVCIDVKIILVVYKALHCLEVQPLRSLGMCLLVVLQFRTEISDEVTFNFYMSSC